MDKSLLFLYGGVISFVLGFGVVKYLLAVKSLDEDI